MTNINKTISLTPYTAEKLKEEFNASALIDKLLRKYWEIKVDAEDEEVEVHW